MEKSELAELLLYINMALIITIAISIFFNAKNMSLITSNIFNYVFCIVIIIGNVREYYLIQKIKKLGGF